MAESNIIKIKEVIEYIYEIKKFILVNKFNINVKTETFIKKSWISIENIVSLIEKVMKVNILKTHFIEDMNEAINLIVIAIENTDYMLASDIFEYEVVRMLEIWKREIEDLTK